MPRMWKRRFLARHRLSSLRTPGHLRPKTSPTARSTYRPFQEASRTSPAARAAAHPVTTAHSRTTCPTETRETLFRPQEMVARANSRPDRRLLPPPGARYPSPTFPRVHFRKALHGTRRLDILSRNNASRSRCLQTFRQEAVAQTRPHDPNGPDSTLLVVHRQRFPLQRQLTFTTQSDPSPHTPFLCVTILAFVPASSTTHNPPRTNCGSNDAA